MGGSLPGLIGQRLLLAGLIALAWWLGAQQMPSFVLPGPQKVGTALLNLWHSDSFGLDVRSTFRRVFAGFALALVFGTLFGLALGASRALARFFEPLLAVFNTVSSAIWSMVGCRSSPDLKYAAA